MSENLLSYSWKFIIWSERLIRSFQKECYIGREEIYPQYQTKNYWLPVLLKGIAYSSKYHSVIPKSEIFLNTEGKCFKYFKFLDLWIGLENISFIVTQKKEESWSYFINSLSEIREECTPNWKDWVVGEHLLSLTGKISSSFRPYWHFVKFQRSIWDQRLWASWYSCFVLSVDSLEAL